jgi:hypothetical protein
MPCTTTKRNYSRVSSTELGFSGPNIPYQKEQIKLGDTKKAEPWRPKFTDYIVGQESPQVKSVKSTKMAAYLGLDVPC